MLVQQAGHIGIHSMGSRIGFKNQYPSRNGHQGLDEVTAAQASWGVQGYETMMKKMTG